MKEYALTIKTRYWGHKLTNKDPRTLRKIYFWYLLRESDTYNVVHKTGMYVVQRNEIKEMHLEYQDVIELPPVADLPVRENDKKKGFLERIKGYIYEQ